MRQYELKETKEINKIICNKCGKEIEFTGGIAREDYLSVDKKWGYFSNKDEQEDAFDLCEECYDAFVKTFSIPIRK